MRKDRIAFVSGGMGGLGAAISRRLYDAGMTVVVSHSEQNDHVATWLHGEREAGRTFHAFGLDVASYDSCEECARKVIAEFGGVDVLVNNAGITRDATMHRMSHEQWSAVIRTNLDSCFNMSRAVIEGMRERRFGRIINISSINGQAGQIGQTNYAAAKAGILGFTKALAQEGASRGVTVNAVAPGYVETDMVRAVPPNVLEQIVARIPVGRLGKPEEIARVVLFLAADEAGFITGSTLSINGGQYMD